MDSQESPDIVWPTDEDKSAQQPPSTQGKRKRISVFLVFWAIGCVGLLIFRGSSAAEDGAQTDGTIPPATVLALALHTALVAIVCLMPPRRY